MSDPGSLEPSPGRRSSPNSREPTVASMRSDTDTVWSTATGLADGDRIVLVHGTLDRAAGLVKLARRLSDRFRVERFDRRGYGRSREISGPYSIDTNVDDLMSVVDRAESPVVLFGHSYGGNVCLAAAQRHPARIRGVAVYEAPMSWSADATLAPRDDTATWQDDPEGAAEGFMRRLVGDQVWERLPASTRRDRRAEGTTMVEELTNLRAQAPWQAQKIEVPVLAMYGDRGRRHHREAMKRLAADAPLATLVEVPDSNHFGPNIRPDIVAAHIVDLATRS